MLKIEGNRKSPYEHFTASDRELLDEWTKGSPVAEWELWSDMEVVLADLRRMEKFHTNRVMEAVRGIVSVSLWEDIEPEIRARITQAQLSPVAAEPRCKCGHSFSDHVGTVAADSQAMPCIRCSCQQHSSFPVAAEPQQEAQTRYCARHNNHHDGNCSHCGERYHSPFPPPLPTDGTQTDTNRAVRDGINDLSTHRNLALSGVVSPFRTHGVKDPVTFDDLVWCVVCGCFVEDSLTDVHYTFCKSVEDLKKRIAALEGSK